MKLEEVISTLLATAGCSSHSSPPKKTLEFVNRTLDWIIWINNAKLLGFVKFCENLVLLVRRILMHWFKDHKINLDFPLVKFRPEMMIKYNFRRKLIYHDIAQYFLYQPLVQGYQYFVCNYAIICLACPNVL